MKPAVENVDIMSIQKSLCLLALLASVTACVPVVAYPPGEGETQTLSIGAGAQHVNQAADPALANAAYPNCFSEEFKMHATATEQEKTFTASAGQTCPGVQIRGGAKAPKSGEPGV